MPGKDAMASPERLERELATLEERMSFLRQESQLFGRLGFSSEQVKFELRRLEKRRVKCQTALNELRAGNQTAVKLDFGQAEG
jgi:hypothetical protein